MKGARKYYNIISGAVRRGIGELENVTKEFGHGGDSRAYKHGNVVFLISTHARGKTFRIILTDGTDKLEVYGITGGQPGWTETYGWLKKGTWVKPILKYLSDLEKEIAKYDEEFAEKERQKEREKNRVIGEMVDKFNAMFR